MGRERLLVRLYGQLLWRQNSRRTRSGYLGLCDLWVLQVRLHQRLLLSGPLPRGLMGCERLLVRLDGPLLRRQGCGG